MDEVSFDAPALAKKAKQEGLSFYTQIVNREFIDKHVGEILEH